MKNTNLNNKELRTFLKKNHIPFWKIAEKMQCCELTVSRLLRKELKADDRNKIMTIANQILTERGVNYEY